MSPLRKLTGTGIYVPQEENTTTTRKNAFTFWSVVFNWEAPATAQEEKEERRSQVQELCNNLTWMWEWSPVAKKKVRVGIRLKGSYYYKDRVKDEKHRNNANRFWSQLIKKADHWILVEVYPSRNCRNPVAGYKWWDLTASDVSEHLGRTRPSARTLDYYGDSNEWNLEL